jgi:hypothetical protein
VACGVHAIDQCPLPWWHLYAGYWSNIGLSLHHQYMGQRVLRTDFQLWVVSGEVALVEFLHAQQRGFEYVTLHQCCTHH